MKNIMYSFIFISLILLITGCSSEDKPIIVKEEMTTPAQESATLVEETDEKDPEESQMMIEFMLEEEQLTINLNKVPILKNYLSQIDNRKQAINEMEINKLDIQSPESIYLLGFAKSNQLYSYLLLDPTGEGHSFLLTDRANFIQVAQSLDNDKLVFNFERSVKDKPWKKNKLMILDLKNWGNKNLTNKEENINITLDQFDWPVLAVDWVDDTTILATIPSIEQPSEEELLHWTNSEQQTKQVELSIINN
ncbi:hypothetical protein [Paraliobacillus sp. JSM ZJ581]|uniref:hypothetical protein n=1 Tax=Paraliobacillus sp. JSM ZJ581 TaxID=3342118 RepID=UPI0035A8B6DE